MKFECIFNMKKSRSCLSVSYKGKRFSRQQLISKLSQPNFKILNSRKDCTRQWTLKMHRIYRKMENYVLILRHFICNVCKFYVYRDKDDFVNMSESFWFLQAKIIKISRTPFKINRITKFCIYK